MGSDPHIRVLSVHVANKIAAGEVVERPASVVKEIIENAIDAGASQIDIEIVSGGKKLISVQDNGSGMIRDDAILSIERQATSKIQDVDDIEHIATLGFRGEALAAIASVSRFRLVTCKHDEMGGTELLVTGGKILDVRDIGAPTGTTIEVRDLFFNVPARRKFLRTHQTELSHVRARFMVQALAHPEIGMSLTIDKRETYRLASGGKLEDRIRDLFGPQYRDNLKQVDYKAGSIRVSGYVSVPAFNRSDRNEQYTFINGRSASASIIGYALKEGYHTLLPSKRFPSLFIFLDMDPGMVDVNVHPTKSEVRFHRPGDVRDAVIAAIREALAVKPSGQGDGLVVGIKPVGVTPPRESLLQIDNLPSARAFQYPRQSFDFDRREVQPGQKQADEDVKKGNIDATVGESPWTWCRVVGQIGGLYVVLETEAGFVLMDPHAAHERVLFEKFMKDMTDGSVTTQGLLIPETVDMTPKDALRVRKNLKLLQEMGFGISSFGGDSFVVDALPAHFAGASAVAFLQEVSETLEHAGARGGKGRWREESIAQAACKAAVKARDKLTLEEIEKIVVDLACAEMPYTCPHGRPTLIMTSFEDLNKKFGRSSSAIKPERH